MEGTRDGQMNGQDRRNTTETSIQVLRFQRQGKAVEQVASSQSSGFLVLPALLLQDRGTLPVSKIHRAGPVSSGDLVGRISHVV